MPVFAPCLHTMRSVRSMRPLRPSRPIHQRGFTLLEVLVALAIVVTALGASIKAMGGLLQTGQHMQASILATWAGENRMVKVRLEHEFPAFGKRSADCPQGNMQLVCDEEIKPTPNPNFRRMEISVHDSANPERRITKMVMLVPNG